MVSKYANIVVFLANDSNEEYLSITHSLSEYRWYQVEAFLITDHNQKSITYMLAVHKSAISYELKRSSALLG